MLHLPKQQRQASSQGIASVDATQRPGITLFISLLGNNAGWLFQWPSTGDVYYRVVLRGQEIARVVDSTKGMQRYVYDGVGFGNYPPPLEIIPASGGLAPSEINQPFLVLQWYGNSATAYYQVQENISGVWQTWFQIDEVGATVYTWQTPLLQDETIHNYQVVAYNSLGQASAGLAFDITPVVTPPDFVDTTYKVKYLGGSIVLSLA